LEGKLFSTLRAGNTTADRLLYTTFSLAGVGIALVDVLKGTFIQMNSKFLEIVGYSEIKLSHLTIQHITYPDDQALDAAHYTAMLEGDARPYTIEKRYVHKNGKPVWVSLNAAPVMNTSGHIVQVFGVIQDITESKNAQIRLESIINQLEASEYRYRILAELCPDGIMVHSAGRIVFANHALANILQAERAEELIGRSVWGIIHPDFHEIVRARVKSISDVFGSVAPLLEEQFIRLDGESICVEVTGSSISYAGEVAVEVIVRDISQKKSLGREREDLMTILKEALIARDTVIGIAGHELKTPLTALKLQMELANRLINQGETNPTIDSRLRRLISSTEPDIDRLISLVDEMLDISRISSGQLVLNLEELDLVRLTREIIEKFSLRCQEVGVICHFKAVVRERVYCDRYRYEQLLLNLLSNALKYGQGKPIEIALTQNMENIILTIRDYGGGMSKEELSHIFKRFERAPRQRQRTSGLGLGLFISDQIVKAHHGRLWVESEPGKGSTFIVELPVVLALSLPPRE